MMSGVGASAYAPSLAQERHALLAVGHVMELDGELGALEAELGELDIVVVVLREQDHRGSAADEYVVHR